MNTDSTREALVETTNQALNCGAFGVPWIVLEREGGDKTLLFGSDRLNIICHLLDVPFEGKVGGVVKLD